MSYELKITTLNDIVDTLKLQFYPNENITNDEIKKFNLFVDKLCELKQDATIIKNQDNQMRFVKTQIDKTYFNVMATSQGSFNCLLINGDISISFLKISKAHSNPILKVEFRAEFLLRNGYVNAIKIVINLIENFLTSYKIKVSEIHLAKDIQGYEFSTFDLHRIKTLSKTKTIFHNDINSEYYFGNRFSGFSIGKGDELLRVYNKTLEISQKKEKSFISVLSWNLNPNFNENQNVWRIEFQLRRERLKYLLGDFGLLDSLEAVIYSISNLWSYCIGRFVHKQLNRTQINEQITQLKENLDGTFEYIPAETLRKRFQRANISFLWENIKSFENKVSPKLQRTKDIKKPEVEYVKNAYKSIISTFIKLKRGEFSSTELSQILIDANDECLEKYNISLVDKARLKALDYIVDAQTYYENDFVMSESLRHFKINLVDNLKDTFALLENEPTNYITFEQFQKNIKKYKRKVNKC